MKRLAFTLFLSLVLFAPMLCNAQGKLYTRKTKLEDFPSKITKVVLSGNPILDTSIKEEIASRWRISPYEFCTVAEYEAQKESTAYYFLKFASDDEFTYLIATKGGKEKDTNAMKEGFDIVACPIAPAGAAPGKEFIYLPAFFDIVQDYIEQARISERVAYTGLKAIAGGGESGCVTDTEEAQALFLDGAAGRKICIIINGASGKKAYRMVIGTDTHKLHSIRKISVK